LGMSRIARLFGSLLANSYQQDYPNANGRCSTASEVCVDVPSVGVERASIRYDGY
jgi:hypothetical protein